MSSLWGNTVWGAAIAVIFTGCLTDQPIECGPVEGVEGKLCREYLFADGSSVGYVQYTYRGDTAIDLSHFDPNHSLKKTETRSYWNGQLRSVVERFADGTRVVGSYGYLPNDSIECIVFGTVDSTVCFLYDAHDRRIRQTHATGEMVTRSTEFRYFEDEDRLFRISFLDANDSITEYRNHIYFFDGTVRIEHYAGDHSFLGHAVKQRSQEGRPLFRQFSRPDGTVSETTDWRYDAHGRLTERITTGAFSSSRSVLLYH